MIQRMFFFPFQLSQFHPSPLFVQYRVIKEGSDGNITNRCSLQLVNVLTHALLVLHSLKVQLHETVLKPSILEQVAFLDLLDHQRHIPYH